MLLAASAGVEAAVVLHGAVDSLLGGMEPTGPHTRKVGEVWAGYGQQGDEEEEEEQRDTIQLFDQCVRPALFPLFFGSPGF